MPHEAQKALRTAVEASSSAQYIKDMAKQFPQLYTALTILLAITAGLIAGKLRNGAKQH
jgi:ribulose 1,5-bisphosphate carboxylase large subunit-like protein